MGLSNHIIEKILQFPTVPGVYLMKGEGGKIIYVGKANNLRDRVKSYFRKEAESRYQIQFLLKRVKEIDFLITSSEKEALLLENSLIKKHKPRYNIFLKDDKSYVSLRLSIEHDYPSLTVIRRIKKDGALYFGPYSSADACRETVDFIYRHFQLRTCTDHEIANRSRPCLEYQIGRCSAPCVGYVTLAKYQKQIEQVRLFLEGKNDHLIPMIKQNMKEASDNEHFEQAAVWRDLLKNIEETLEKQKVVRHGGLHQDLIFLYREGEKGLVALLSIRDGNLIDSRYYPVDCFEEDEQIVDYFLSQYYLKEVFIPDEILSSHLPADMSSLSDLLTEKKGKRVTIHAPQRGEKKDLLDLAQKNAQSQFARLVKKELQVEEVLKGLQEKLGLSRYPHRMECYDISNISGKKATGSRVVFIEGKPDKKEYRHYRIRLGDEPNDYAMLKEVMERRFRVQGSGDRVQEMKKEIITLNPEPYTLYPDLLVIDGGKGQLRVASKVLEELGITDIPVIAIAKGKGPGARAKGNWEGKKEEEIYLPGRANPLLFQKGAPELSMLQNLRDEAHRFAIKYHRHLRDKIKPK